MNLEKKENQQVSKPIILVGINAKKKKMASTDVLQKITTEPNRFVNFMNTQMQ